jgi:hypothetical protein
LEDSVDRARQSGMGRPIAAALRSVVMGPGLRRDDLVVVPSCLGSQRHCFDSEFANRPGPCMKIVQTLHSKAPGFDPPARCVSWGELQDSYFATAFTSSEFTGAGPAHR